MHNYIIVARKQDLADLVNYGEILLPCYSFIPYQGEFEALSGNADVRAEAFEHVNPFSYTTSYVVLDVRSEEQLTGAGECRIGICQVMHVAPLDRSGKVDMQISWGEGFKFSEPLWDSGVRDIFVANTAKLARLGAHDMWDIFGITEDIKPFDDEFSDAFVRRFCECVYDGTGHTNLGKWTDQTDMRWLLWLYLLRYERHQPWPSDKMGYVYDAVNTFYNWYCGTDLGDSVRNAPVIAFLDLLHSQSHDMNLVGTFKQLKMKASDAKDENDQVYGLVKLVGGNGYLGTMAMFLLMKSLYVASGNNLSKIKAHLQNVLGATAKYEAESDGLITASSILRAIYMLGLTITREGTGNEWYLTKGIGWIVPLPEKKPEPAPEPKQATYTSKANTQAAKKDTAKKEPTKKTATPKQSKKAKDNGASAASPKSAANTPKAEDSPKTQAPQKKQPAATQKPAPQQPGTLPFASDTPSTNATPAEETRPAPSKPQADGPAKSTPSADAQPKP